MKLIDVYSAPESVDVLWGLLSERRPEQSISHKGMPTVAGHKAFIASRPYEAWYLIDCGDYVGATYLSKQREIGIGILNRYKGNGYGPLAVKMLMARHPGKFFANINPSNRPSIDMFAGLGFQRIQVTYAKD